MLHDDAEMVKKTKDGAVIRTERFHIKFILPSVSTRGHKAHFVLNLVQDKEFHDCVAMAMTSIQSYLKEDSRWSHLLGGE